MLSMTMALLMFAMPITTGAQAAPAAVTFTVNSTLDQPDDLTVPGTCHTAENTCTLRAAIMQANRTSGAGATILLPSGTYALTIPAAGADGEEKWRPESDHAGQRQPGFTQQHAQPEHRPLLGAPSPTTGP